MKLTKALQLAVDQFHNHGGTAWLWSGYRKEDSSDHYDVRGYIANVQVLFGKRQAEALRKRLEKLNVIDGRMVKVSLRTFVQLIEKKIVTPTKMPAVYKVTI